MIQLLLIAWVRVQDLEQLCVLEHVYLCSDADSMYSALSLIRICVSSDSAVIRTLDSALTQATLVPQAA